MHDDFICLSCPLEACDEESLFCALRWATSPNEAQLQAMKGEIAPPDRKKYMRDYYAKNREKKRAAALVRYHETKCEKSVENGM